MYRYELHMHTAEGSACGVSTGAQMVDFYLSRGYAGMAVTDHFYHGNTAPDRQLPWAEYVERFSEGYRNAKKAAQGRDFDVFFGVEEKRPEWSEFIILGLEPEWYAARPELRDMDGVDFLKTVRAAGAFIIQAHPYRERPYMLSQTICLLPDYVDALEVRNCGNLINFDRLAYPAARAYGKLMTGGSDNHSAKGADKPLSGIALPHRCHTVHQLIAAMRAGQHQVIDLAPATEPAEEQPTFTVNIY